jgi:hypothetical protein
MKLINITVWEIAVLVLIKYAVEMASDDMRTKFHEDWCGSSGSSKFPIAETAVLVLLWGRIYDVRR